jgi:tripartite-type tricarboxylate transporter receptor subunit TctC
MKKFTYLSFAAYFFLVFSTVSFSQEYPNKPLRFVIGYAPGGVADLTSRVIARKLSEVLLQQVVVENYPSAGGIVAAEIVSKSKPDGYTLLLLNYGDAASAAFFKRLNYNVTQSFSPISTIAYFDLAVITQDNSDIKNLSDLIRIAKKNPKKLNIGTISIGSGVYFSSMLFLKSQNIDVTVIPYKSTPAIIGALKARDIDFTIDVIYSAVPHIESKEFRGLAVTSKSRFNKLPDTPTLEELGITNYRESIWNGVAVSINTPASIINKLNQAIKTSIKSPEISDQLSNLGITTKASTPEEFGQIIQAEVSKWNQLIDQIGLERQ